MSKKDECFYANLIHSIDPQIEVKRLSKNDLTFDIERQ